MRSQLVDEPKFDVKNILCKNKIIKHIHGAKLDKSIYLFHIYLLSYDLCKYYFVEFSDNILKKNERKNKSKKSDIMSSLLILLFISYEDGLKKRQRTNKESLNRR